VKKLLVIFVLALTLMARPCFGIHYCQDFLEPGNPGGWGFSLKTFDDEWILGVGEEVDVDIWINDVPMELISAGFWIVYDPSMVSIVSVDIYNAFDLPGPWNPDLSVKVQTQVLYGM